MVKNKIWKKPVKVFMKYTNDEIGISNYSFNDSREKTPKCKLGKIGKIVGTYPLSGPLLILLKNGKLRTGWYNKNSGKYCLDIPDRKYSKVKNCKDDYLYWKYLS